MADLPAHSRVVVIGGGVAGCSVLYHLVHKGWRDVLLLERDELTAGSTWHAAGNCPNFSSNTSLMRLQAYSTRLYRQLAASPDYPINYHVTGSLRLAHDDERMTEYELVRGKGRYYGVDFELLSAAALKKRYPFLETHGLVGALWDPLDGDIDPAQLTQALARAARAGGARIVRACPVEGLSQAADGHWVVTTAHGEVRADIVVNAAGYLAPQVAAMMGRQLPSVVLEHQYLVTASLPELAAREGTLPLLRDPDESYYLRQERDALLLGPYEHHGARAVWADGLPTDFAFQLFPDDLDRIESYISKACERVPLLASVGIRKVVNGPIPYTPDGNPLIGPVPGLRNAFECCAFSFGITQGGGAGKLLADWIVDGEPEWDLWSCDPRRFTAHATPKYTQARALEVYHHEYAIAFPNEERPAGRPTKTSPVTPLLAAKGARFGARNGWERPTWFPRAGDDPDRPPTFARPAWFETVAEECKAVARCAGVIDMSGFTRFEVGGAGAATWLDRLSCSRLPAPGRVGLAYLCGPSGAIVSELTIARLASDRFWLISAAAAQWHDRDWLHRHLPDDGSVRIDELTDTVGTLVLAGPHSRGILAALTDAALDSAAFPWCSARRISVAGVPLWALRINYVGELGWELHAPLDALDRVYSALWTVGVEHGLVDFGLYAMDSLRLEKGYRGWKQDIDQDLTPLEAGLDRFVDAGKTHCIGAGALAAQRAHGLACRVVSMTVDSADCDASPGAAVLAGDDTVGLVTSAGYGHRVGRSLALAVVHARLAAPGTALRVAINGQAVPARVVAEPLYDPHNLRLRA